MLGLYIQGEEEEVKKWRLGKWKGKVEPEEAIGASGHSKIQKFCK